MSTILERFIAGDGIHKLYDYYDGRRMSRAEVWNELQGAAEHVRTESARNLVRRARSGEPEAIRLLGESIVTACASETGDYETEAITPWGSFDILNASAESAKARNQSEDQ